VDHRDIPIFINTRDLVSPLRRQVDWLLGAGQRRLILVDNDSRWPDLLTYFEAIAQDPRVTVLRLGVNYGPQSLWRAGVLDRLEITTPFAFTDPDIVPDPTCPPDLIGHLLGLLARYPDIDKAGVGLRIDDLPDHYPLKASVVAWEAQFWDDERDPGVFQADVDTTLAVYRPGRAFSMNGVRTGAPYLAQHLPWYRDAAPDAEFDYYRQRAPTNITSWTGPSLPQELGELIANVDGLRRARLAQKLNDARRDLARARGEAASEQRRRRWLEPQPVDPTWYAMAYPDAVNRKRSAADHFATIGYLAGHAPTAGAAIARSGLFDDRWYLACNPDVAAAGIDPIDHYLHHGWREGRRAHPAIDAAWYREQTSWTGEILTHYLAEGYRSGLRLNRLIDPAWYARTHGWTGEPLGHALAHDLAPCAGFDSAVYRAANPDVVAAGMHPISHFVDLGAAEGRRASADAATAAALIERGAPGNAVAFGRLACQLVAGSEWDVAAGLVAKAFALDPDQGHAHLAAAALARNRGADADLRRHLLGALRHRTLPIQAGTAAALDTAVPPAGVAMPQATPDLPGLWIIVSFKRPEGLRAALASAVAMGLSTPGVVVVHGDPDPAYDTIPLPADWQLWRLDSNGGGLGPALRTALERYPGRAWYGLLYDDMVVRTPGWDRILIDTAGPDGIACSHDLWQCPGRLHGALVFGGALMQALGDFLPPPMLHSYIDDVLETIASRLGLWRPRLDVVCEHLHPHVGKRAIDVATTSAYMNANRDAAVFDHWLSHAWPALWQRLRDAGFDRSGAADTLDPARRLPLVRLIGGNSRDAARVLAFLQHRDPGNPEVAELAEYLRATG
jgi:hypothetical protein